jgi:antitoxin ParD1/3/4
MDVPLKDDDQAFVDQLIAEGRYGSSEDAVRDGLRMLRLREVKLAGLREMINRSIAQEGRFTDEEVEAHLEAVARELEGAPTDA